MATLLQQIGAALGLSDSEPLVSGNTVTAGTTNAAFHLDIHDSTATGEQVLIAAPNGATIIAETDQRALIIGGTGDDRLTGGDHADLLVGGGGANVSTGGGGTDTFGHAAGATDVVTDFSAAADEHIAVQSGLTWTGSSTTTVNAADFGLSGGTTPATALAFSDGSQILLLHTTETPDSSWFV